jgi:RimJ/RimL family protein N-acetyltransferase
VPLAIRPAEAADARLLFEWVNDPVTRAQSFSSGWIDWTTHSAWVSRVLADPARLLFIILAPGDEPVGQARFEPGRGGETVISISLAPAWRGRGLGALAIRLATDRARRELGLERVHAYIRTGNIASRRAFASAGYKEEGATRVRGKEAVHLTDG